MTPPSIPERCRVLVVKPSSLGDVVHTLPAVAALKRHRPQARISWLINPEWAPLLEGNPHVDEVLLFPRGNFRGLAGLSRALRWARHLRRSHSADVVLDFQCLLRSALIGRMCRAKGGRIYGLSDGREGARLLYNREADVSGKHHAVERYLALIEMLGIPRPAELEWPLPEGSRPAGLASDIAPGSYVLLHPFSRGAGKSMSAEGAARLCEALAPYPVVVAGRADHAVRATGNNTDLLNRTTLPQLVWLLRNARFVISVDSGPMHIAAALQKPLLSLHTWSDPREVGPYPADAWVWQNDQIMQVKDLHSSSSEPVRCEVGALGGWVREQMGRA